MKKGECNFKVMSRIFLFFGIFLFMFISVVSASTWTNPNEVFYNFSNVGNSSTEFQVKSCSQPDCSDASFFGPGENSNLWFSNLSLNSVSFLDDNRYFQYKTKLKSENPSYSPVLMNFSLNYTVLDTTPPWIELDLPLNESNLSSEFIYFNYTAFDDFPTDLNCSLVLNGDIVSTNSSIPVNSSSWFNVSVGDGFWNWIVGCFDGSGNYNVSKTRNFYNDILPPVISGISHYPTLQDDLDPNTTVYVNATVIDNWIGIDSVILEVWDGLSWENYTMFSVESSSVYQTNFTTLPFDANYTYRIFANDSFENSNRSINNSFMSKWDCTWNVTKSGLD